MPARTSLAPSSDAMIVELVSAWISPTIAWIWPADSCDRSASLRTSEATTAKPRPCSPARAASMAALRASRLVWSARSSMTSRMRPISWLFSPSDSARVAIESTRSAMVSIESTDAADGGAALLGVAQGLGGVAGDRLGGLGDLGGRGGELLDRRRRLGDRGGLLRRGGGVLLGGRQQLAGGGADLLAAAADLPDEVAQVADGVVEGGATAPAAAGVSARRRRRRRGRPSAARSSTPDSSRDAGLERLALARGPCARRLPDGGRQRAS